MAIYSPLFRVIAYEARRMQLPDRVFFGLIVTFGCLPASHRSSGLDIGSVFHHPRSLCISFSMYNKKATVVPKPASSKSERRLRKSTSKSFFSQKSQCFWMGINCIKIPLFKGAFICCISIYFLALLFARGKSHTAGVSGTQMPRSLTGDHSIAYCGLYFPLALLPRGIDLELYLTTL